MSNVFDAQTNLLIRDGLAAEVFFGDLDGETMAIDNIEDLAAPMRYLLDQRSTLGYKSLLYLDALARQMNYYAVFEGSKLSKSLEEHIKAPLYIPNDVIELIKTAFEKAYLQYIVRGEEKFEGFADILSIWRFHNDELIPKYVAHIQAEGILEDKPSRQMFSKISENKRALTEAFSVFSNMLADKKEIVKFFAKHMTATPLFAYFNKKLIRHSIFNINTQESEAVSGFLSYRDRSGKNRIVLESSNGSFLFSMLASERPIFEKGEVKAQNVYTVADVLLYSETSKSNKKHEEALKSIYGVGQLYGNKEFETKIREALQLSAKYEEAYIKINKKGNYQNLLEKSYLKEAHDAIIDNFILVLRQEAEEEFSVFLENESKKSARVSSFSAAKESFAFSAALYVIKNIFNRKIHLLPIVDDDSFLRELQDKEIRKAFRRIVDTLVPQYLAAREAYIAQNHSVSAEGQGNKEVSEANKVPEQPKAEKEQVPQPEVSENDTMPKKETGGGISVPKTPNESGEDDEEDEDAQKITVSSLKDLLDEFGE